MWTVGPAALTGWRPLRAQPAPRQRRIGYIGYTAANTADDERVLAAFRQRLRELGLEDGRNLTIEWRFGEGRLEREQELATELLKLGVELVVVGSGTAARAVMAAGPGIPVVTIAVPDPVRAGLVQSLARPGGQVTGISNLADDLTPKRLELLKTAVPSATRIAIARCPQCVLSAGESHDALSALYETHADAAKRLGVTLLALDVNDRQDFDAAAATLKRERPPALLINATQINHALRSEWVALAQSLRLPSMASTRSFGAMLSYGPDFAAIFRRAAEFIALILNGTKPADLPMEQPTRFEFVVNLKFARAIGVDVSRQALQRADEVIE
ncbi:MAG TPA: ABC transporter substrate-binding protein [Burkholderiaceae bacterium]